ncbi:MAG: hypothetical protein V4722_13025 [Bacteroidota bacterium]
MENFELGKKDLLTGGGLLMDDQSASEWRQAAGWAKALAILCIVGLCIMLLALAVVFLYSSAGRSSFGSSAETVGVVIGMLLVLSFGGIWVINLFRFSNNTPAAINNCDPLSFEKGIKALKTFFMISTVVSVLSVLVTGIRILVN